MNSTDPPGEEARPVAQTLSTEERIGGGQRRLLSAWIGQERISERCPIDPSPHFSRLPVLRQVCGCGEVFSSALCEVVGRLGSFLVGDKLFGV